MTLDNTLVQLIYDAQRFIQQFFDPISQCALQVYHTSLCFAPHCTLLQQYEQDHAASQSKLIRGRDEQWSACLRIMEGHSEMVLSVAFSSDYTQIVSGSSDCTVQVWNA